MGQMVYFPNGAKSGEKTAVNGAAPHFGIRRNFFWLHSFFWTGLDWTTQAVGQQHTSPLRA